MLGKNFDLVPTEKTSIRKHFGFKHDKNLNFVDCTHKKNSYDRSLSVRRLRTKSKDRVLKKPKHRHRFCFIPKDYKYSKRDVALLSGNETNDLVGMFAQKVSRPKYITHLTSAKARKSANFQKRRTTTLSPLITYGDENFQRRKGPWLKIRATLSKSTTGEVESGCESRIRNGSNAEMETDIVILSPAYNIEFNGHSNVKPIKIMSKEKNYDVKKEKTQVSGEKLLNEQTENKLQFFDCCGDGNNEVNKQILYKPKCLPVCKNQETQKTTTNKEIPGEVKEISIEHPNLQETKNIEFEDSKITKICKDETNLTFEASVASKTKVYDFIDNDIFSSVSESSSSAESCIEKKNNDLKFTNNKVDSVKEKNKTKIVNPSHIEKTGIKILNATRKSLAKSNLRGSSGINLRKKLDYIYVKSELPTVIKTDVNLNKNKVKQFVDTLNKELVYLSTEMNNLTKLNKKTLNYHRKKTKSVELLDSLIENSNEYCKVFNSFIVSNEKFHNGLKNEKHRLQKTLVNFKRSAFVLTIFTCLMFVFLQLQ